MYLSIILIIVAILVFYNEINTKMDNVEYVLLAISLIAIIRASINYMSFDNIGEGFTSKNNNNKNNKNNKNNNNNKNNKNNKNTKNNNNYENYKNHNEIDDNTMIINSEDSKEYLDSDESETKKISNSFVDSIEIDNARNENKKSSIAVNHVNDLLGIVDTNISNFADIPTPTRTNTTDDEIKSVFSPKVIIGKGKGKNNSNNDNGDGDSNNYYNKYSKSSSWNNVFVNDGFKFNNTMSPDTNLWRDKHGYYNGGEGGEYGEDGEGGEDGDGNNSCKRTCKESNPYNSISRDQWSQGMDAYNRGKWQRNLYNRPSDYVDYKTPNGYGTTTPDSSSSSSNSESNSENNNDTKKKCGPYDTTYEDDSGNLIVKDYKDSKKWVAGYTYVPPIHWDVPQKHNGVCKSPTPNVQKLTGLVDRGLPLNALELNSEGKIADKENDVTLTNIGSMVPKFNYQEQPFSKPYV